VKVAFNIPNYRDNSAFKMFNFVKFRRFNALDLDFFFCLLERYCGHWTLLLLLLLLPWKEDTKLPHMLQSQKTA
jgi:hypothetical protein